jgi:hypothetical protein
MYRMNKTRIRFFTMGYNQGKTNLKKSTRKALRFPLVTLFFILALLLASSFGYTKGNTDSQSQKGTIKGCVVDAELKSPIPGAKIKVVDTPFEIYTDTAGNFTVTDIPVGSYTLEISSRFYITRLIPDVIVKSRRTVNVQVLLRLDNVIQEEEVTVTASYFSRQEEQPSSTSIFSNEEIRRSAGSAGDVSRILTSLPSIAKVSSDMVNTLVVRGGNPAENAFYIDNIEVPNINHYPNLGSTSGAIGLLNVDFIRDVRFYAGGFSPIYGDRMSSIMDISFREGNRDERDYQLELSMMGMGLVAEGPLAKDRGSWMFSVRRSYIDLLIGLMGQGVPVSWNDFQGKLNIELSRRNKLIFIGIGGVDDSGTEKEDALKDKESFYGGQDSTEYTVGVNWFFVWGAKGYSSTSLSQSYINYKDTTYHTVSEELAREGKNSERIFTLRNINYHRFNKANKLSLGIEIKHLTNNYDYFLAEFTDALGNAAPAVWWDYRTSADQYAAFINHTWNPFSKLTLNLGVRGDYFTFNQNWHLSPRFSFSWKISSRTSIDGAAGIFHQHLPLVLLFQNEGHKSLKDPVAYHAVLGMRHLLTDNTRFSVEAYIKEYNQLPVDPAQPSLFIFDEIFYGNHFTNHESLLDSGKARSLGIEFMIQKKLANKLYGVISASYFRSCYKGLDGVWRNRVYDNRLVFSSEGGYKLNKFWEFGLKWIYAGGAPYTPFDVVASQAVNSGVFDETHLNGERLPAYHSLNLRFDKRFYFSSSNLIIYFSVWNVYNRKNVFSYYWNTIDTKPDRVSGWGLLPVLGVEFEF